MTMKSELLYPLKGKGQVLHVEELTGTLLPSGVVTVAGGGRRDVAG